VFLFGGLFGVDEGIVSMAAVTRMTLSGGPYALFANGNNCNGSAGLEISGSNNLVTGGSHGNGDVKVNGTQNTFNGGSTYRCDIDVGGQNNTFTPAAAQNATVAPPPVSYSRASFVCDYSYAGNVQLSSKDELWLNDDPSTDQLKNAVICSDGQLTLSSSHASGSVTLVGREVQISGSNANLSAYHPSGVLAFTDGSGNGALVVSGSDAILSGLLYSQHGESRISGARVALQGGMYGEEVRVSGSNVEITASGMGSAQRKITIIQ
jgi:hypothetical protein